MTGAGWAQTILSLSLVLVFLGFLIWGIKSGQFRNIEEPKYRILEDGEPREETSKEEPK